MKKNKYYFIAYWFKNNGRGRTFVCCDRFRIRDIENYIAQSCGIECVIIDYYKQITEEEYQINR